MTTKVSSPNTVSLDGVLYRITRPVLQQLASVYPGKLVIGDTSRDSQVRASVLAQSDWRGGIGLFSMEQNSGIERLWFSTCWLRSKHQLTLQRLATATATATAATVGVIAEFENEIYATFGTAVHKYNNVTNSWGASLNTLDAAATDTLVARVNGTAYLFIATTTGYTYFDGTTWTNDTEDIKYLTWWGDKVWGIDNAGQLRYSTFITPGSWVNDAVLPLSNGFVTDLFVGMDVTQAPIIYASTKVGLYAHDFVSTKFIATKMELPRQDNNGLGTVRWRDSIYFPSGLQIFNYTDGGSPVVSLMGPDQDDGLPSGYRGVIRQLVNSNNELITTVDASPTNTSTILGWDGSGWQVLWTGSNISYRVEYATVSGAYDVYRLWWAENQTVYWMAMPREIINPDQATNFDYATTGFADTPWFNAGQIEVNKLALLLEMVMADITANDTITLSYGLDLSETWTELAVFDTEAVGDAVVQLQRIILPSKADPKGKPFDWIRFRFAFARGATTTRSPKLQAWSLVFRKKLPVRYGFEVELDLRQPVGGKSPAQLRAALIAAIESDTLVEFTYRADDAGTEKIRTYFVDVMRATNLEQTGLDESGISQVSLVQV